MSDKDRKPEVDRLIDDNLRRAFRHKAEEEIPQRLVDLLNKLRDEDSTSKGDD